MQVRNLYDTRAQELLKERSYIIKVCKGATSICVTFKTMYLVAGKAEPVVQTVLFGFG